jgi:antitoxin (DNA-binding transcriptional repressor) of toxin-antitoxin stability system
VAVTLPKLYNVIMKTLSVSEGRRRLGYWLKKAQAGEDIGFTIPGGVVALRPVEIYSNDYALREYGVTSEELDRFIKNRTSEIRRDRKAGRLKTFTGKL